jgi:hypothetical protein
MFEEFDKSKVPREGRGRMGVSFLISGGIFFGIMAALAAAIATARVAIKRKTRDVDVSFAELPRAPKPKPKVKPAAPGKRKLAMRQALVAPKAIPDVQPAEAEGQLAEAGDVGPIEGFTDGEAGGRGGAGLPQQETEMIREPEFVEGCRQPDIPDALHSSAATIQIDVRMLVDEFGRVKVATLLTSHPLIPEDVILRCARAQVFKPAHLPDGTTVPYPFRRRFVFKPAGV